MAIRSPADADGRVPAALESARGDQRRSIEIRPDRLRRIARHDERAAHARLLDDGTGSIIATDSNDNPIISNGSFSLNSSTRLDDDRPPTVPSPILPYASP